MSNANPSPPPPVTTVNCTYMKATSDGAWTDSTLNYALPLLIIQLCLVVSFSRFFALILRPLKQPRVIAEILGGIVLGRSCMGQIPGFTQAIFPPKSLPVLTTVANLGLTYYLFLVGLELDLRQVMKVGKSAMFISIVGIVVPFGLGIASSFAAWNLLNVGSAFGPFTVFMGVAMAITAFPVLARILAESKLLTTQVGQMAMSVAAVDDVMAWVLLALAVALSTPGASPIVVVWILLCGIAFVILMFVVVAPLMKLMLRRVVDNEPIPEWIVAITLIGVLVSSLITDVIGIHGIFGAFVYGLILPKDGPFCTLLLEKIEDFVGVVLLPLYFASSGLQVYFQSITPTSIGMFFLIIATAIAGKLGGIMGGCLAIGMPLRTSLTMGVLMNTKGLVELIVLNIGLSKKVINVELYTIMVIMALVTTFMTSPLLYLIKATDKDGNARASLQDTGKAKSRRVEQLDNGGDELRMMVCVHGMHNIPGMLNFTEVSRGTRKRPLKVYLMHLVELSERSSAIVMVTRLRKDGRPYLNKDAERKGQDQVVVAFSAYAQLSRVAVQPLTCISAFDNMHEDICETAADKRTSLIVVPYYKARRPDGGEMSVSHGFQAVNRKLLRTAPCSVGILVDRGLGGFSQISPDNVRKHIAMLFFGGPDDREALAVARRMEEHPGVSIHVVHFKPTAEAAVALDIDSQVTSSSSPGAVADEFSLARSASQTALVASFVAPTDKQQVEMQEKYDQSALQPLIAAAEAAPVVEEAEGDGQAAAGKPSLRRKVQYEVREVDDVSSALLPFASASYDLIIVGRGRRAPLLLARMASQRTPLRSYYRVGLVDAAAGVAGLIGGETGGSGGSELGPVGDTLVASDVQASLLVVQQHDAAMARGIAPSSSSSSSRGDDASSGGRQPEQ